MQKLAILVLMSGIALPLFAAKPVIVHAVTVAQLEEELAAAHGKKDADVARHLSELKLTERMGTPRLVHWEALLPGDKARRALIAVADASVFLDLPAADTPVIAAPDSAAQDALLAKTIEYAQKAIPRLPDFFATEKTIHFADGPVNPSRPDGNDLPLHVVAESSAIVHYLGGQEELDAAAKKQKVQIGKQLTTEGVFGSVLGAILKDGLGGKPAWSHWEQGTGGPIGVFRYAVLKENSHYEAHARNDPGFFSRVTGYHGEIGVDPATGAILRLTMLADLGPTGPIAKADILVEYGPVEIGGIAYICPLRSVARSLARPFDLLRDMYGVSQEAQAPMELNLNDVTFGDYHLFRAEMRMLTGDSPEPGSTQPGSAPAPSPQAPATAPQR